MTAWPYPADSPTARARRIAQAYREALNVARPDLCAQLDAAMNGYGETWIAPAPVIHDLDDWLTPAEAADIAAIGVDGIRALRHRDRLQGTLTSDGWRYRYRDVLDAMTIKRRRSRS